MNLNYFSWCLRSPKKVLLRSFFCWCNTPNFRSWIRGTIWLSTFLTFQIIKGIRMELFYKISQVKSNLQVKIAKKWLIIVEFLQRGTQNWFLKMINGCEKFVSRAEFLRLHLTRALNFASKSRVCLPGFTNELTTEQASTCNFMEKQTPSPSISAIAGSNAELWRHTKAHISEAAFTTIQGKSSIIFIEIE